jgi:hypothetical protein
MNSSFLCWYSPLSLINASLFLILNALIRSNSYLSYLIYFSKLGSFWNLRVLSGFSNLESRFYLEVMLLSLELVYPNWRLESILFKPNGLLCLTGGLWLFWYLVLFSWFSIGLVFGLFSLNPFEESWVNSSCLRLECWETYCKKFFD